MGPPDEMDAGIAIENMSHEPVGFLDGIFHGSQLRCTTVNEVIVITSQWPKYLPWSGARVYTDNRIIAYISYPAGVRLVGFQSGYTSFGELENGSVLVRLCGANNERHDGY